MADAKRSISLKLLLLAIKQLRSLARRLFLFKTIRYTCYEFGHTWTPSCRKAALLVLWSSFKTSLKIYSSLYLVTAILKRRKRDYYLNVIWKDILRSTAFLTTNAVCFITTFCTWRKVMGFYCYYFVPVCAVPISSYLIHIEPRESHLVGGFDRVNTYASAVIASALAFAVEQPSRHGMLAMYTTNLALETLYNMLTDRGVLPKVPYGEIGLFSAAMAGFMYFYRVPDALDGFICRILSTIFGTDEITEETHRSRKSSPLLPIYTFLPQYCKQVLNRVTSHQCFQVKHGRCTHQWGCLLNVLEKFIRCFGMGYGLSAALQIPKIISLLRRGRNPIGQLLFSKDNFSCGAFLAGLSSLHQAVSCLLRWGRGKTNPRVDGLIAGAVSGLSLYFYRSSVVSLYVFIRLIDLLCRRLAEQGKLPIVKNGYHYAYAISTALLFHAAVWEPHNIRPPYWKFMLNITGEKFSDMNRRLIDHEFGTDCSRLYPDFWPKYDPRFTDLTIDCLRRNN